MTLTNIVLDDLELRSTIIKSVSIPVKNQGGYSSVSGFSVDLDTGVISAEPRAGSDLIWNPPTMLSTNGSSGVSITGTPFVALTPVQISRLPLAMNQISAGLIPLTFPPSFPFLPHNEVVFGVRTTEGRLAKVRAWRSIQEAGALYLDWITFDTPAPSLDIAARWSVLERGEVSEYITPNCSFCRSNPVRQCGIFEAWSRLAAFPIDYQWCLCGEVLEDGTGEVSTKHGPLAYRLVGRRLYIETELAQPVDCELCVSAIDARGLELYTCIRLNQSGIEKRCRRCDPRRPNVRIEMLAAEAQLTAWHPLLTTDSVKTIGEIRRDSTSGENSMLI